MSNNPPHLNYKLKCQYRNVFFDDQGNYVFGPVCGKNRKKNDFDYCSLHKSNAYYVVKKLFDQFNKQNAV
jgi:hypothetical protein